MRLMWARKYKDIDGIIKFKMVTAKKGNAGYKF